MNREFKLRFDQMREGNPAKPEDSGSPETESETGPLSGYTRTLCLIWPNGRRFFLNYAYLLAGELKIVGEKNEILLYFSSHTVMLRGYGLKTLFSELLEQGPRRIRAADERYVTAEDANGSTVIDMDVQKTGD